LIAFFFDGIGFRGEEHWLNAKLAIELKTSKKCFPTAMLTGTPWGAFDIIFNFCVVKVHVIVDGLL